MVMLVKAEILINKTPDIIFLNLFVIFHQFAYRTIIHMITETLLGFNFVTVSNCHVVHLVSKTDNQHILCISPCDSYSLPDCNFLQNFFVCPVTDNYFAANAHAGADMSELAVSMRALV